MGFDRFYRQSFQEEIIYEQSFIYPAYTFG
jgi:hypothetical protein